MNSIIDIINEEVQNCNKCDGCVEKFSGNTIYLGKRKDIIILGEAPANNGWRKSGLVWRDINGKFLPSAKVLDKLLKIIKIELLEITFIEAIKCYPIERRYLNKCAHNCYNILRESLNILKPNYIIALGEQSTRILLNTKEKFSDIVGEIHLLKIDDNIIKVIPIYHPSPISPKSYIGNVPIFEKIKNMIK